MEKLNRLKGHVYDTYGVYNFLVDLEPNEVPFMFGSNHK